MSEQTPEFGGWATGRAAGDNRRVDSATDRLEREINRFADALEKYTSRIEGAGTGGVGGQQSRSSNGGNVTFSGGAHAAGTPLQSQIPTSHRANVSTQMPFTGGGTHRAAGMPNTGAFGTAAKRGGAGLLAAGAVFTANHYSTQVSGQTLASMAAGSDWNAAYQAGFTGNYTAHGDKDHWATISMMVNRAGADPRSAQWKAMTTRTQSYSAVNPAISNQQGLTAQLQAQSVGATNRMVALGINPMGGDPRGIARQLLSRMGSSRVKTKAQADAAFAPNGSAVVTLDNYAASGALPAGTRDVVESEMRRILYAQVNGMEYQEYNRLANRASQNNEAGEAARNELDKAGISTKSLAQGQARQQGHRRGSEAETIVGFSKGVKAATETLGAFRRALNKILSIPGVGESVGLFSGLGGTLPIPYMPGGLGLGGDGPSSLSSYSANFGPASGSANARPGFGTAGSPGTINARGGSGSVGSAKSIGNQYSLGAVKPWVAKAAGILGPKFGIKSILGVGQRGNVSDHPKGLALDFMCSKSAGDSLAAYAVANHKQLNITYVIWRQRIWSINQPGWRSMEDRGSPTANHMDHVHVSFLASPTNGDFGGMVEAGGGLGAAVTAETLGSGSSSLNLASAGTGSGFSAAGGFSEAAALGLGGTGYAISGGAGGGMPGSNGTYSPSGGGGGGGRGYNMYGGGGRGGNLKVGTFNALFSNSTKETAQDFDRISGKVDVLGWQELDKRKSGAWSKYMRNNESDWGHYQSKYGDTAVSWNEDKYRALQKGSHDEIDSVRRGTNAKVRRGSAYVLLQDKNTGAKFWVVSTHLQAHRKWGAAYANTQDKQMEQVAALNARLRKTGIPVINVGDYNNLNPNIGAGSGRFGRGIDQIFSGGGSIAGGGSMGTNSDHPFVWANINLPGGKSSGNGGSVAQNISLGQQMASQRGWTGAQWSALKQLWMRESGWRTNADNPSSSAYGIPQALTELHGLGDKYKSDPKAQILWGLNYIAGRYGNPSNAWKFWQQKGYYRSGLYNAAQDEDASIHQGEMILPAKIASAVRSEITGNRRGGSGGGIVFQPGSIQIIVKGGTMDRAAAKTAANDFANALAEHDRFKALAEGL
jgi:hypothetical protein